MELDSRNVKQAKALLIFYFPILFNEIYIVSWLKTFVPHESFGCHVFWLFKNKYTLRNGFVQL